MKLIDSDRLKRVLNKNFGGIGGAAVLKQLIDNQPTVDAVPVVRCGYCKFFHLHPNNYFAENAGIYAKHSHYCDFGKCEADRFNTDFCSYGERKNENGNTECLCYGLESAE